MLIRHLKRKGICCCNATENTIRIFLNLKQNTCLNFVNKQILSPIMKSKYCSHCEELQESQKFKRDLFNLLNRMVLNSSGSDLKLCLFHLQKLSEWLEPHEYCNQLLNDVILPLFRRQKAIFLQDLENVVAKNILIYCTNIFLAIVKDEFMIQSFFTSENLDHIRDLCLVPDLAQSMCNLLKLVIQNSHALGNTDKEQENLSQKVIQLVLNNTLYLIDELTVLFAQLGLEKEILHKNDVKEADDEYEILDEAAVAVKQGLKIEDVLLLNALYWNMICKIACINEQFQVSL